MEQLDLNQLQKSNAQLRKQLADMDECASAEIAKLKSRQQKCNIMAVDLERVLTNINAQLAYNQRVAQDNQVLEGQLREMAKTLKALQ